MKVSKQQAAENREHILVAAARLFREGGIASVGVDAVGDAASLTYGSVYSQFGSKEQLAAEAIRSGYARAEARGAGIAGLPEFLAQYLSPQHRDNRGSGCFMAAMGGEMPRQTVAVRNAFTTVVKANIARIASLLGRDSTAADDGFATFITAAMVGAMVLSRAVDDPVLADRLIEITRRRLSAEVDLEEKASGAGKLSVGL